MSLIINTNTYRPIFLAKNFLSDNNKPIDKKSNDDSNLAAEKRSNVLKYSLASLGAVALAILYLKNHKKAANSDIKKIIGKNPKVEKLTTEEKEKLIKELQAKTDNPDVKEEIRKLVENGEWDKL